MTPRRAQLFDQLVDLFLAEGFAHLTLDNIAGRLHCSKSTIYTLAGSKEQLVKAAVVHFFRGATGSVESEVVVAQPRERISAYLVAVGIALRPASEQFMTDLSAFAPAREVYERNTRIAARRVQELIEEQFHDVHAAFLADVAASTMVRIQQRDVHRRTGLDDAQAYAELAELLTRVLLSQSRETAPHRP